MFAKYYNGPAYTQNRYDVKLEAVYLKLHLNVSKKSNIYLL